MHRHTVLFNFKDEVDGALRDEVIASLRSLADLATVETFHVAKNLLPRGDVAPYEWLIVGDFADQKAREVYEKDEKHVAVVRQKFLPNVKNFAIIDVNLS